MIIPSYRHFKLLLFFHRKPSEKNQETQEIAAVVLKNNNLEKDKMALAKIPDQMETAPVTYGPDAEVQQEITEETTLREVQHIN